MRTNSPCAGALASPSSGPVLIGLDAALLARRARPARRAGVAASEARHGGAPPADRAGAVPPGAGDAPGARRTRRRQTTTTTGDTMGLADQPRPKAPKPTELMDGAEHDVLAHINMPREHRAKIHSTNPIEGLNGALKRRTYVVGIFPNEAAITRPIGATLLEQSNEWAARRARHMTLETIGSVSDDSIVRLPGVAG